MKSIQADFELDKITSNTYRYAEKSKNPKIRTLYINKSALEDKPQVIKVTVEWEGSNKQ